MKYSFPGLIPKKKKKFVANQRWEIQNGRILPTTRCEPAPVVYPEMFITTQGKGTFLEPVLRVTAGAYRKK